MRGRDKIVLAGVMAGVVMAGAVIVTARAMRRRRKRRMLPKQVRRAVAEVIEMQGKDFLGTGTIGESLFHRRIDRLDDRQLVVLYALVRLGRFAREAGIDPLHPNAEQLAAAVAKFTSDQDGSSSRTDIMERLEAEAPGNLKAALRAALDLLAHAEYSRAA